MKKSILVLTTLFCFYYGSIIGQCFTNAGPDIIICTNMFGVDTTQIGVTSSTIGGIPPYTYSWETNYTVTVGITTITKTASEFLNDTTLETPLVVASAENPVIFILTVTDSIGNICTDTVVIQFSHFMINLGYLTFNIAQGDSIYLNYGTNVSSNFPPFQYLWKPNIGLSDSTSYAFWAKPNSSVAYYVTLTDSAGCSIEVAPYYYINVSPVGLNEFKNERFKITAFPNPTKGIINFFGEYENNCNLLFEFFDTKGQLIKKTESKDRTFQLKTDAFSKGIIFYKVTEQGNLKGEGKLIVE